jgi:hypothetical protein
MVDSVAEVSASPVGILRKQFIVVTSSNHGAERTRRTISLADGKIASHEERMTKIRLGEQKMDLWERGCWSDQQP